MKLKDACFLEEKLWQSRQCWDTDSRDINLSTKVHIVKGTVFPVVIYGCESWTIKKAECFKLWCWRRLLRVPWTARRSNLSIPMEINSEYSLEELMLKLKLQYFDHLLQGPTHWKRSWFWERLRARGEGGDRGWDGWMASLSQWSWVWANSWSRWWTWSLACCSPWGHKELDMT